MNIGVPSLKKRVAFYACTTSFCAGIAFGQATNSADVTGILANGAGIYDSGPLIPTDHYLITFKKEGFTSHYSADL